MLPDTNLRIANSKSFKWLLQPELKAIKDRLKYVEDKVFYHGGYDGEYNGYINAQAQRHGVGINFDAYRKIIGEWHNNNLHGIAMVEYFGNYSDSGNYKQGLEEGYLTRKFVDRRENYYQYKNGGINGYGIRTTPKGLEYRGEFKNGG
jgi:hypothetical protein